MRERQARVVHSRWANQISRTVRQLHKMTSTEEEEPRQTTSQFIIEVHFDTKNS